MCVRGVTRTTEWQQDTRTQIQGQTNFQPRLITTRKCTHTHTHTHTHAHTHTHTHRPVLSRVQARTCTHVPPPPPPHTHTHIHTRLVHLKANMRDFCNAFLADRGTNHTDDQELCLGDFCVLSLTQICSWHVPRGIKKSTLVTLCGVHAANRRNEDLLCAAHSHHLLCKEWEVSR